MEIVGEDLLRDLVAQLTMGTDQNASRMFASIWQNYRKGISDTPQPNLFFEKLMMAINVATSPFLLVQVWTPSRFGHSLASLSSSDKDYPASVVCFWDARQEDEEQAVKAAHSFLDQSPVVQDLIDHDYIVSKIAILYRQDQFKVMSRDQQIPFPII